MLESIRGLQVLFLVGMFFCFVILVSLTINYVFAPFCSRIYRRIALYFFWLSERNKIKAIANHISKDDPPIAFLPENSKDISLPGRPAEAVVKHIDFQDALGRNGQPISIPSEIKFADGSNITVQLRTPEEQREAIDGKIPISQSVACSTQIVIEEKK